MGALTLIKGVGKLDIYQMIDGKRSDKLEESRFNYADLGVSPIYISPNPQTGGLNLHVVSHRWAGNISFGLSNKVGEYDLIESDDFPIAVTSGDRRVNNINFSEIHARYVVAIFNGTPVNVFPDSYLAIHIGAV